MEIYNQWHYEHDKHGIDDVYQLKPLFYVQKGRVIN